MTITTKTIHVGDCDRYAFDFQFCQFCKGWAQLDTQEDASYFGNWAHPDHLQIISFAEGDVSIATCEDSDEFRAEVERIASFFIDKQNGTFRIDPGTDAERRSSWASHGLKQYLA